MGDDPGRFEDAEEEGEEDQDAYEELDCEAATQQQQQQQPPQQQQRPQQEANGTLR